MVVVQFEIYAQQNLAYGPLWEPLCYAQIGGLTIATFITLLLVPVLYSIFVLDLRLIKWELKEEDAEPQAGPVPASGLADGAQASWMQTRRAGRITRCTIRPVVIAGARVYKGATAWVTLTSKVD